jgi:hypothetical protein
MADTLEKCCNAALLNKYLYSCFFFGKEVFGTLRTFYNVRKKDRPEFSG